MTKWNFVLTKVYAWMVLWTVIFWGNAEYAYKWVINYNDLRSKSREERRKEYEKCYALWSESFGYECEIKWKKEP